MQETPNSNPYIYTKFAPLTARKIWLLCAWAHVQPPANLAWQPADYAKTGIFLADHATDGRLGTNFCLA